jgi:hypothetical protein
MNDDDIAAIIAEEEEAEIRAEIDFEEESPDMTDPLEDPELLEEYIYQMEKDD